MRKRTILFYGDSNTYGYDPADYSELRYPKEKRWTCILQKSLSDTWNVIPQGLNGRRIPDLLHDGPRIEKLQKTLAEDDIFAVMLGTNDILLTMQPDASDAIRKMQDFLAFLKERRRASSILLIAPVHIGNAALKHPLYQRYFIESKRMNKGFQELSEKYGTLFLDAGEKNIDLSADFVHFSEEGHRQFAKMMEEFLQETPVPE